MIESLIRDHDLVPVGVAALLCVFGSLFTLRLFQRLRTSSGQLALTWLFLCAVAAGATIWCTHFIAMLAYRPGALVSYDIRLTAASLLVAIIGSAAAFSLARSPRRWIAWSGGLAFGLVVSAMHYVGMFAYSVAGGIKWTPALVALSIVASALFSAISFAKVRAAAGARVPAVAVIALVCAILLLHFTGMAAMQVSHGHGSQLGSVPSTSNALLVLAVGGVGMLVIGTGISGHVIDLQLRRQSEDRFDRLIQNSVDGIVVSADGVIQAVNPVFAALIKEDAERLIGQSLTRWIRQIDGLPGERLSQAMLLPAVGAAIPVELSTRPHGQTDAGAPVLVLSVRDIRQRLRQERKIAHLARHDSLTGLPNRAAFLAHLEEQIERNGGKLALLAIDLDRFKEVNDIHGHAAGDQLLTAIAMRMHTALQPGEFLARLGGDEFIALGADADRESALGLANRLHLAGVEPVVMEDVTVSCGASIGIALWPDDARTMTALINNADLAMYRAKASIADHVCFYEEAMDEAVRQRRRMVQQLRQGLDREEFELHYQAQASIATGRVTGFEALLRWRQEDGSYLPPTSFITIAEESGLIIPLGQWVLENACREAAQWPEPLKVAVNLSPVQISHVDLPVMVARVLDQSGLPPALLELEITETAMISDVERTTRVLRQLKELGVSIAMDDFGTGYSSLSTLRAFPFNKIKLDRSFMDDVATRPQSQAIIRAVLALGESLEMPVLAEGVETIEQLLFLQAQGCQEVQGYLIGRPAPAECAVGEKQPLTVRDVLNPSRKVA